MTEKARAVVDEFERLSPDEQTQAYLAIEQIWKGQDDNLTSDPPTSHPARKFPSIGPRTD
jgi:hypothetical protein